jgi:cell wall-associated NlpC family hydrolase
MDAPHIKAKLSLNELIGRPYKVGGRGPADYDCWGLCMKVAEKTGDRLPDLDIPQDDDLRGELVDRQRAGSFKRLDKPSAGCLVLFRIIDDAGLIKWHVGTVLPDGRHFIHTTQKMGVNISGLDRQPWKLFIEGFYQYQP